MQIIPLQAQYTAEGSKKKSGLLATEPGSALGHEKGDNERRERRDDEDIHNIIWKACLKPRKGWQDDAKVQSSRRQQPCMSTFQRGSMSIDNKKEAVALSRDKSLAFDIFPDTCIIMALLTC